MTTIPYRARSFKLDRMHRLMQELGNPHHRLRVLHLAGTKGKGSTATFLSNILWHAGYRVGRFTSPHLEKLEERYWCNGEICSEQQLVDLVDQIRPIVEKMDVGCQAYERLTFFEITTAMGFLLFDQLQLDFAVIEVGLGGRLDSTNVCRPTLTTITSISLDHTELLGNTLREIAHEKAGIIKSGTPTICGANSEAACLEISRVAQQRGSPISVAGEDFRTHPIPTSDQSSFRQRFAYQWKDGPVSEFEIGVKGKHQVDNAGLAIANVCLLRELGFEVNDNQIAEGLVQTQLPGRIECLSESPTVIVDVAHNEASAKALIQVLNERFGRKKVRMIYASSGDKDHAAVLAQLASRSSHIWLTKFRDSPRVMHPDQLLEIARLVNADVPEPSALQTMENALDAFSRALETTETDEVLVITGSFFIAAEFKAYWAKMMAQTAIASRPSL